MSDQATKWREYAVRYPNGHIRIMPSKGSADLEAYDTDGHVLTRVVTATEWEPAKESERP